MSETFTASEIAAARFEFIRCDKRLNFLQRAVVADVLDHDFVIEGERRQRSRRTQVRLANRIGTDRKRIREAVLLAQELGYWKMEERPSTRGGVRFRFVIDYDKINAWTITVRGADDTERQARLLFEGNDEDETDGDTLPSEIVREGDSAPHRRHRYTDVRPQVGAERRS
jgi:hypothetical protein